MFFIIKLKETGGHSLIVLSVALPRIIAWRMLISYAQFNKKHPEGCFFVDCEVEY